MFTFVGILREIRFAVLSLCGFVTLLSAKANFSLAPTIIREGFKYNGFFFAGEAGGSKKYDGMEGSPFPFEENIFGGNHLADMGCYGKKPK